MSPPWLAEIQTLDNSVETFGTPVEGIGAVTPNSKHEMPQGVLGDAGTEERTFVHGAPERSKHSLEGCEQ